MWSRAVLVSVMGTSGCKLFQAFRFEAKCLSTCDQESAPQGILNNFLFFWYSDVWEHLSQHCIYDGERNHRCCIQDTLRFCVPRRRAHVWLQERTNYSCKTWHNVFQKNFRLFFFPLVVDITDIFSGKYFVMQPLQCCLAAEHKLGSKAITSTGFIFCFMVNNHNTCKRQVKCLFLIYYLAHVSQFLSCKDLLFCPCVYQSVLKVLLGFTDEEQGCCGPERAWDDMLHVKLHHYPSYRLHHLRHQRGRQRVHFWLSSCRVFLQSSLRSIWTTISQ